MVKMTDLIMKISPPRYFSLIAQMMTSISNDMLLQVLNFIVTDYVACLLVNLYPQPLARGLLHQGESAQVHQEYYTDRGGSIYHPLPPRFPQPFTVLRRTLAYQKISMGLLPSRQYLQI